MPTLAGAVEEALYRAPVLGRPSRADVALLLAGVLVLFVGVIAQLAVTDGVAETLWGVVSIVGAIGIVAGVTGARPAREREPTPGGLNP